MSAVLFKDIPLAPGHSLSGFWAFFLGSTSAGIQGAKLLKPAAGDPREFQVPVQTQYLPQHGPG